VLLRQARSNQPFMVLLLPILFVLFWFKSDTGWVHDMTRCTPMPLYQALLYLAPVHSTVSKIIAFIFVIVIAFMLNRLNTKFIFIPERTYLPSIIYLIIVCGLETNKELSAVLPAMVLLLLALERILNSYKVEKLSYNSFDASFLLGIASLFYFNIIFYIALIWFALSIIRSFYWREWVYTFLGFAVPYLILFSIYYLTDRSSLNLLNAIRENFSVQLSISMNKVQYIFIGYLVLLILLASQQIIKINSSQKILARKSFNLFLICFLISLMIFLFLGSAKDELIYIAGFPLALLLAHYFIMARKSRWLEIMFDVLVLSFILIQFLKV
jgi:hypothetical protein